jgi:hypothetical protein
VADRPAGSALGLSDHPRFLEVEHLTLSAKQFPLEVTLQGRVAELFAEESGSPPPAAEILDHATLLQRLRNVGDPSQGALESIQIQGQAAGDLRQPAPEDAARLRWADAAFTLWECDFPLDPELSMRLRRLKPLCAGLAVVDTTFLVPGRHPLHRLLDSVQAASIGWQASLGRAGSALQRELDATVDQALAWFDQPDTDLHPLLKQLESQLSKDAERAQKMARRVVEMAMGKEKKTEAAATAAHMINTALQQYSAPAEVGQMLKGPWYDSAQLVLLKFGPDSDEWAEMCKVTDTLLDSVQVLEPEPEERRQHLFRVVTLLPKKLKQSLLSLQHDNNAVNDAVSVVEFAHLCMLRNSPLETISIEPLPLPTAAGASDESEESSDGAEVGQWYLIEGQETPLRARIIFRLQDERKLLFANRTGMECLRLGCDEFSALLAGGKARKLQRGASFSRCLAASAGVTEQSDLEQLARAGAAHTATPAPADEPTAEPDPEAAEQARLWAEWEEARARQRAQGEETPAETGD